MARCKSIITFTVSPSDECRFRGYVLLGGSFRLFRPQYREALAAESEFANAEIITTDELLSEFLTFFAGDA